MKMLLKLQAKNFKVNVIDEPENGDYSENVINVIDLDNIDMDKFEFGKVQGMCGKAAYEYIEKSVSLANDRKVDA